MMGSWRYHPVSVSDGGQWRSVSDGGQWRSGTGSEAGLCPMCGHRSRSVSRGSRPGTGDRMYNYLAHLPRVEAARSRSRPSEAGRHARLSRTTDVTKLWSSQITEASGGQDVTKLWSSQIMEASGGQDVTKLWSSQIMGPPRRHSDSSEIYAETYSYSQSSSQNNIYEDIEGSLASEGTLDTLGTTHNSLYFCISEGRRNQLKLHKNVDWDIDIGSKDADKMIEPTIVKDDHADRKEDGPTSSADNLINRKRLQLKRSLNRTCSSIIESIKSIF